jgi:transglutaminase-like putative cysteine protease
VSSRQHAVNPAIPAVAALTTWVAMFAWRGFTEEPQRFLAPLLLLAVVVAGGGVLLRAWRTPGPLVVLAQVVVSGLVAAALISRSWLPVGSGWTALQQAFQAAQQSAVSFAPPVPADAPGVHPYLVAGGLGCLLLVDLLACTLRRASLAGLPLLSAFSVPVGMLAIGLVWWVFALAAVGYLALLYLEQGDRVRRWGRSLQPGRSTSGSGTPPAVRMHAGAIGGGVTVAAVLLPLLIPTLSVQLLDLGRGSNGDTDIKVVNPTTDLRRDLQRPRDVPLIDIRTDDPDPSYLRIATLTRFSDNEWSSGDRDIPAEQVADGPLPPLVGVAPTVPRSSYTYALSATTAFSSTWLPTPAQSTSVVARGDWRYDTATRDFIASDDDLSTAGLDWSLEADKLDLDATALARAGSPTGLVTSAFLETPRGIPPYVRNLGLEVTRSAPSDFEKAVALQNWFRDSGGFTYSTDVSLGTGTDDLVAFLSPRDGGRTGYCEQFASSMALMARQLGIPARVAVGFLQPEQLGDGVWEYSTHDLHAWPELFFADAGWVRFEPTPPGRASGVPDYTAQGVTPTDPDVADVPETTPEQAVPSGGVSAAPVTPEDATDTATTGGGASSWWPWVVGMLAVAALAGLVAAPGLVRRRRRDRRRSGGVEAAWAELRDTALDLGLPWPEGRSPRETGDAVRRAVGHDDAAALGRMVARVERTRYAPAPADPASGPEHDPALTADVDKLVAALRDAVSPRARRRAAWLPRSVLRRSRDTPVAAPGTDSPDRLLERV